MKGLIFDIKRFAVHDGPGIRTTIFFKGCSLQCSWCHNPESCAKIPETIVKQQRLDNHCFETQETVGKNMTIEEVMQAINKDAVFYDESGGGVTLSGGEPLMQAQFAIALLKVCKRNGYHTALDTSGFVDTEILKRAFDNTDLFLYDLKHHNQELHKRFTGVDNTLILDNLKFLIQHGKQIRIRIPVIPGINNTTEDFNFFIKLLNRLGFAGQIDLLPYHNLAHAKYKRFKKENQLSNLPNMIKDELLPAKDIFEEFGFSVRIGG